MKKEKFFLYVKGKTNEWSFPININPKYIRDWTFDGLKIEKSGISKKIKNAKKYGIDIRGKRKDWTFEVWIDEKDIPVYRSDGLNIDRIENSIPAWWVDMGFPVRLWCFLEDAHLVW